MEDVSISDLPKEEDVPKKKRRVLKRVLKKDKAKGIQPKLVKRKLNTSLSSLSKSLNRSGEIRFVSSPCSRFELTISVVIGTDCIGSCKSNYHTIKATTAPEICFVPCVCLVFMVTASIV
jgi:hypothetical protein